MSVASCSTEVQLLQWLWNRHPVPEPKYLTSAAAARALGIGRTTLWRWQNAGEITPAWLTPKGHARWDIADLRRQLTTRTQTEEDPPVAEPATTPERPPIVAAIVTSELGVLISRRHDGRPPWGFITGEIEPRESPTDAAIREAKEETGLRVRAGNVAIARRVHPKTGRTIVYLACTSVGGTDAVVGDEEELAELRWVNLAEADRLMPDMFTPVREHLGRIIT